MRFSGNAITDQQSRDFDSNMKSSTFLITINTNHCKDKDIECEQRLELFCKQATEDENFLIAFLNDISDGKDHAHKISKQLIEEVHVHSRLEVGPQKQRYHCHILFLVRHHTTKIFIDLELFRRVVKAFVSNDCYVNIRGSNIGIDRMLGYLNK